MTKGLLAHYQQKKKSETSLGPQNPLVFIVSLNDGNLPTPLRQPDLLHLSNTPQTPETFTNLSAALLPHHTGKNTKQLSGRKNIFLSSSSSFLHFLFVFYHC